MLTKSTWKRSAATVLAATAASVLMVSGTAHANDIGIYVGNRSGWASWTENGDSLQVCDDRPDGWGVRGYIYEPNGRNDPGNGTVRLKASDPKSDGNCVAVSVDVNERITLSIKVCNYKGASIANCAYAAIPGRPIVDV